VRHGPTKRAACTLIQNPRNGNVISISRGQDIRDWALPGGELETPERPHETARRELYEETGIRVPQHSRFLKIFEKISREHLTSVFVIHGQIEFPEVMGSKPFEGYVTSLPPAELCKPSCSFADFHLELFRYTGIL